MEVSQSSVVGGLLGAAAVGLFFALPLETFRFGSALAGITILLVLLAHVSLRSALESVAHGAVCGLALMLALRPVLANVATASELQIWFTAVWVVGTVLFTFIDRSRVAAAWAAQSVSMPAIAPVAAGPGLGLLAPLPAPAYGSIAAAAPAPAPVQPAVAAPAPLPPAPEPVMAPPPPPPPPPSRRPLWDKGAAGAPASSPAPQTAARQAPVAAQPVAPPPPPAPVQAPPPAPAPAMMAAPPPPPEPPAAPQPLAPLRPGAEITTIYVDMTSGGYACLRGVQAEHLTRDIYRILEPMPAGEEWKYTPGQVVRCKKEKLSTGKAMVAIQEVQLQQVS